MPFIRLNQHCLNDTRKYDTLSNIYKSYRREVELLTASSLTDMHIRNYMDCYVELEQHKQIEKYLESDGPDNLVYLTGVTGSGKTTVLKAALKHQNNNIVFNNNTAIITFVWKATEKEKQNSARNIERHYANFLLACVNKIADKYSIGHFDQKPASFLKFIEDNDLDFFSQSYANGKNKIMALIKENPLKLAIFALRFIATKTPVDNIIFLFDELEEAGKDTKGQALETKLIETAYSIKHFLSLRDAVKRKAESFRFTVIISCRHYVYRMITLKKQESDNEFWSKVNAESQSELMIDLSNPPTLLELLEHRKHPIRNTIKDEKDKKEFDEVFAIIKDIVMQCGETIMALAIGNIRDAFKYIQYLIFNKRWLQRKESVNGAFSISASKDDYNLSLPSYIRAIGLRENVVYSRASIIPNLLDNTEGKGDLTVLVVLLFFINKQDDPNLRSDFYSQFDLKKEFNTLIEKIFPDEKESMYIALNYLLKSRILLRSSHCCQADSADDPCLDDEPGKWPYVFIAKQASILWKLLSQNSVLFELFVDDVMLETHFQTENDMNNRKFLQFNFLAFKESINYLLHLIDVESSMIKKLSSRSYLEEYKKNFGTTSICRHLYSGLKKSFDAYYREKEDSNEYMELSKLLNEVLNKLNLATSLNNTSNISIYKRII